MDPGSSGGDHTFLPDFEVFLGVLDKFKFPFERLSDLASSLITIWAVQAHIAEGVAHLRVCHEARSARNAYRLINGIHLFRALRHSLKPLPAGVTHSEW